MKKLFFTILIALSFCLALSLCVYAKEAYVERVPANLLAEGEALEYFIVLDGEEYFNNHDSTLSTLNEANIKSALDTLASKGEYADAVTGLGTKYMIKYIFPSTVNGTEITYIYLNNSGFKTSSYFKKYCAAIVYAPTHNKTGDANDCSGTIRSIDFGENSQMTQIPLCYMQNAYNLREIKNFPRYLTSIEENAFSNCRNLTGILYVNSVTIKRKAFENAIVNTDGIIIGKDTVNIATEAFGTREVSNGSKNTKFIEFQCDITKMNIVASAQNQGAFYFSGGTQRNPYSALTCLVLSHPDNQALIKEGETTFQDFLPNVYFNEDSKNGGNLVKKGHNNESTIMYESFLKKGTKGDVCKDCGASLGVVEVEPIINCLGYSFSEFSCAISQSFAINHKALNEYNEAHGENDKITSFGVFAISCERANGSVFDDNNQIKAGACLIEYSSKATKYDIIEMRVQNITDAYKSSLIYCAGYITVGTNVIYIDNNKTSSVLENGVSFDSLIK